MPSLQLGRALILSSIGLAWTMALLGGQTDHEILVNEGNYLGLSPPGDTPELFAPGIVSTPHHEHSAAIFSPAGNELYWTVKLTPLQSPVPAVVLHTRYEKGRWSPPEVAPFSGMYADDICSVSPDGQRLYVSSHRPHQRGEEPLLRADIWVVKRTENVWSEPEPLDPAINSDGYESDFQETRSGNVYFVSYMKDVAGEYGIYRSRFENGKYSRREPLGGSINTEYNDWCPFVDPAEEYMIFSSNRPGGIGGLDLWISFRQSDDSWGPALNLGPKINSGDNDRFPKVSPDGRYLFFLSKRTALPRHFDTPQTYDKLQEYSASITNGLSNIYWVDAGFIDRLRQTDRSRR